MRCSSGIAPPSPRSLLVLLAALGLLTRLTQGGELDHHRVGPEDLVRRRVGEPHHAHNVYLSGRNIPNRSEEHTSELQSRLHLVCRLLLEKKKTHIMLSSTGRGQE